MLWNCPEVLLCACLPVAVCVYSQCAILLKGCFVCRVWNVMITHWNKWLKTTTTISRSLVNAQGKRSLWWSCHSPNGRLMMGVFASVFECMRERKGREREWGREKEEVAAAVRVRSAKQTVTSGVCPSGVWFFFSSPSTGRRDPVEQMLRSGAKSLWERSIDFSLSPETQEVSDCLAYLLVVLSQFCCRCHSIIINVAILDSVFYMLLFLSTLSNGRGQDNLEEIFKMSKFGK